MPTHTSPAASTRHRPRRVVAGMVAVAMLAGGGLAANRAAAHTDPQPVPDIPAAADLGTNEGTGGEDVIDLRAQNSAFIDTTTGTAGSAQTLTPEDAAQLELNVTGSCDPSGTCRLDAAIANRTNHTITLTGSRITVSVECDGRAPEIIDLSRSTIVLPQGESASVTHDAEQNWQGMCLLNAALHAKTG